MSDDLNAKVAKHLWTTHRWQLTAKMVDGPEHLNLVYRGLAENHVLEHRAAEQGNRLGWREHDHDAGLEPRAARS